MKTREKGYSDYGFTDGDARELMQKIATNRAKDDYLCVLRTCCNEACDSMGHDLYVSLTEGDSYETREKRNACKGMCMPITKTDFYGYRRKAVALFYERIKNGGGIIEEANGQMTIKALTRNW